MQRLFFPEIECESDFGLGIAHSRLEKMSRFALANLCGLVFWRADRAVNAADVLSRQTRGAARSILQPIRHRFCDHPYRNTVRDG